jgi:hypothetical protein
MGFLPSCTPTSSPPSTGWGSASNRKPPYLQLRAADLLKEHPLVHWACCGMYVQSDGQGLGEMQILPVPGPSDQSSPLPAPYQYLKRSVPYPDSEILYFGAHLWRNAPGPPNHFHGSPCKKILLSPTPY